MWFWTLLIYFFWPLDINFIAMEIDFNCNVKKITFLELKYIYVNIVILDTECLGNGISFSFHK